MTLKLFKLWNLPSPAAIGNSEMITVWMNLDQPVQEPKYMPQLSVPQTANLMCEQSPPRTKQPLPSPRQPTSWPQICDWAWLRSAELCPVQKRAFQPRHYWRMRPDNSLFWGCSAQYRMFSSISGLHPLNASSIHHHSDKNQKYLDTTMCPPKGKITPSWDLLA